MTNYLRINFLKNNLETKNSELCLRTKNLINLIFDLFDLT